MSENVPLLGHCAAPPCRKALPPPHCARFPNEPTELAHSPHQNPGRWKSNPPVPYGTTDFKSVASAVPPRPVSPSILTPPPTRRHAAVLPVEAQNCPLLHSDRRGGPDFQPVRHRSGRHGHPVRTDGPYPRLSCPVRRRRMQAAKDVGHDDQDESPVPTGIAGLDDILRGGLTPARLYLVEGNPGSGKT